MGIVFIITYRNTCLEANINPYTACTERFLSGFKYFFLWLSERQSTATRDGCLLTCPLRSLQSSRIQRALLQQALHSSKPLSAHVSSCPWSLPQTPAAALTHVAFPSLTRAHVAGVSREPPSRCLSGRLLSKQRKPALAGSPSTLAHPSTRHGSFHWVNIHALRCYFQQRLRLAHQDHFGTISLAYCSDSKLFKWG